MPKINNPTNITDKKIDDYTIIKSKLKDFETIGDVITLLKNQNLSNYDKINSTAEKEIKKEEIVDKNESEYLIIKIDEIKINNTDDSINLDSKSVDIKENITDKHFEYVDDNFEKNVEKENDYEDDNYEIELLFDNFKYERENKSYKLNKDDLTVNIKPYKDLKNKKQEDLTEAEYKSLIEWYNYQIYNTGKFCRNFTSDGSSEKRFLRNCLENYPKCVSRSIRQLCNCNENCIGRFSDNLEIEQCYLFEPQTNFFTFYDNEFVDCCWPSKFPDDQLKYIGNKKNLEKATTKFHESVIDLCLDNNYFLPTRCALFELQDECSTEEEFTRRNFIFLNFDRCANEYFDADIRKLKDTIDSRILNINIYSKFITKREIGNNTEFITQNEDLQLYNQKMVSGLKVGCLLFGSMASGLLCSFLVDKFTNKKMKNSKRIALVLSIMTVSSLFFIGNYNIL